MALKGQALLQAPQLAASRERSAQKVPPGPAQAVPGAPQVGAVQMPVWQFVPPGQIRPQPPQLPWSLEKSVQNMPPPVGVGQVCAGHVMPAPPRRHAPSLQYSPAAQLCPQLPQSAKVVMGAAQYMLPTGPGQSTPPPRHSMGVPASTAPALHAPFMHALPFGQTLPHALQLRGSFWRSVQKSFCPLGSRQGVWVAAQLIAGSAKHVMPWQYSVAAQAWPQAPQLARSCARSTQAEAPAASLQVASEPGGTKPPSGPGGTPPSVPVPPSAPMTSGQRPFRHCIPAAQTRPQPPQFLLSVRRSKPSSTLPLQSLSKPSQISGAGVRGGSVCTSWPAWQLWTPAAQRPTPFVPA